MPDLQIESGFLPKLRERIRLARDIEKAQHNVKKEKHDRNWLREAAEAMDVDIDPTMCVLSPLSFTLKIGKREFFPLTDGFRLSEGDDDSDAPFHTNRKGKPGKSAGNLETLKAELKAKLAEPLVARGVSARYPTSGSRVIIDELIQSTGE